MSVSSPCQICGDADVEDSCDRCGQLVCADHFDESIGRCIECAAELPTEQREGQPTGDDMPDGVDTYRF